MSIHERLVEIREKNGYTRKRLAEELGRPYATITKYETGERDPGHSYIIEIAKKFGVSTDYILGVDNDAESEKNNAPTQSEDNVGGNRVDINQLTKMLISGGFVKEGQDLSDSDLRFLIATGESLRAWFSEGE